MNQRLLRFCNENKYMLCYPQSFTSYPLTIELKNPRKIPIQINILLPIHGEYYSEGKK